MLIPASAPPDFEKTIAMMADAPPSTKLIIIPNRMSVRVRFTLA